MQVLLWQGVSRMSKVKIWSGQDVICRFNLSQRTRNKGHHRVFHVCFILDILLNIDINGKLTTQLYDKRDDFSFSIVNFPYLCSNIPSSPAYGVYVSQLIRYARACSAYDQLLNRGKLLTDKLLLQGFQQSRLKAAFRKFYGRYNNSVYQYDLPLSPVNHLSLFLQIWCIALP